MGERLLSHLFSFHLKTKVKVISILYGFFFSVLFLKLFTDLEKNLSCLPFLKKENPTHVQMSLC